MSTDDSMRDADIANGENPHDADRQPEDGLPEDGPTDGEQEPQDPETESVPTGEGQSRENREKDPPA